MKAIILSAGQGKRLMPLTANVPKCLLNIRGLTLIEWQINELNKAGVDQVAVVVGYQADRVRQLLRRSSDSPRIRIHYNPAYAWTDNLFSCWVARAEMDEEFILLNGDTIFEAAVVNRLRQSAVPPVTVAIHQKRHYDADDMKVTLAGNRLVKIGKDLAIENVDGESIGMILFRREGPSLFRRAVERALRDSAASRKWYLSVIDDMARSLPIQTCLINGLRWCEVDFPADLKTARRVVQACGAADRDESVPLIRVAWA